MMRARIILAVALAALGITACIIGPKQDDPNALGTDRTLDANTADSSEENLDDTSPATAAESGGGDETLFDAALDGKGDADAKGDGDAKADGDAATDAAEGG